MTDLQAQLQIIGEIFDAKFTLLKDGSIHILYGHSICIVTPLGDLESGGTDLEENHSGHK